MFLQIHWKLTLFFTNSPFPRFLSLRNCKSQNNSQPSEHYYEQRIFLIFERKWSKYMMERGHFGEKWQIFANFMYKRVGFKNCQNGSNFTCSCFSCIKWDFWELFKKRFPLLYIPQQSFVRSRQNTIVCCWVAEIKSGRFVCLQVFQEKGTSFSIWEESEPHSMIFFAWTILRVITLF